MPAWPAYWPAAVPQRSWLSQSSAGGNYSYALTPTLTGTTLLYSASALNYGAATPAIKSADKLYFSGRSDKFAGTGSTNSLNARLDPEGIRVSNDGKSVFISDEYGPYVYQFNRATGERIAAFALPSALTAANRRRRGRQKSVATPAAAWPTRAWKGLPSRRTARR